MGKGEISIHKKKGKMSKRQKRLTKWGIIFAIPWLLGFLCFQLYPICVAVYHSLCEYNIFKTEIFIGFENYRNLFNDPLFWKSVGNTLYVTAVGLPLSLVVALLLAMLLSRDVKGISVFRTIYYLPTIVPVVASAALFLWVLNSQYGIVNSFLAVFGIRGPSWLTSAKWTKFSLILMDTWRCGGMMVIFLSAIKAVPQEFYEAAKIDGAGPLKSFFGITLPQISPTIQFNFIIGLISYFQYFTQAYVFTGVMEFNNSTSMSGPKNSLLFYSIYLYKNAFINLKMGYACAMAIILFIVVAFVSFLAIRISNSKVSYDVE